MTMCLLSLYVITEHLLTVLSSFFSFLLYIYLCLFFAYFSVYHKLVNKDLYNIQVISIKCLCSQILLVSEYENTTSGLYVAFLA